MEKNRRPSHGQIGRMNGTTLREGLFFHVKMNKKERNGLQQLN